MRKKSCTIFTLSLILAGKHPCRKNWLKGCVISMETETNFTIVLNKCCKNSLVLQLFQFEMHLFILYGLCTWKVSTPYMISYGMLKFDFTTCVLFLFCIYFFQIVRITLGNCCLVSQFDSRYGISLPLSVWSCYNIIKQWLQPVKFNNS